MAKRTIGYKKLTSALAKSNPEIKEIKEEKKLHKTLVGIINDIKLKAAIEKYGYTISFAEGYSKSSSYNGYNNLEISPKEGYLIVIRELDFYADHGDETHNSRYRLYLRDDKVYFKGENDKEYDAAKTLRHNGVFGCNVDHTKKQTSETVLDSLENAIANIIKIQAAKQ